MLSLSQQPSIFLWDTVLRSLSGVTLINEVLIHVGTRTLPLPKIEVLFHALVTDFLILVVFVIEPIRGCWISHLTVVADGIFALISVGTWCLIPLLNCKEVRLCSETESHLVNFVFGARFLGLVLNWYLLLNFRDAAWNLESLVFTHRVLVIAVRLIIWLWAVTGNWWRT